MNYEISYKLRKKSLKVPLMKGAIRQSADKLPVKQNQGTNARQQKNKIFGIQKPQLK